MCHEGERGRSNNVEKYGGVRAGLEVVTDMLRFTCMPGYCMLYRLGISSNSPFTQGPESTTLYTWYRIVTNRGIIVAGRERVFINVIGSV